MSTRAHILVKGGSEKFYLYHHHDGYPEGVGKNLKNYLNNLKWTWYPDDIVNDLVKGHIDEGYEITSCMHGDEEYLYLIDCDVPQLVGYEILNSYHTYDDIMQDKNKIEIP